jgi:hypothetical protein
MTYRRQRVEEKAVGLTAASPERFRESLRGHFRFDYCLRMTDYFLALTRLYGRVATRKN